MKKLICAVLSLAIVMAVSAAAFADGIDLSALTWEELLELKAAITLEQLTRDEWEEVEVPQGVYKVGEDIPAGKWTVTCKTGRLCYFEFGEALREDGHSVSWRGTHDLVYIYKDAGSDGDQTENTFDAKEGYYIVIEKAPATFSPFIGKRDLGFSKGGEAKEFPGPEHGAYAENTTEPSGNENASTESNAAAMKEANKVTIGMQNALKSAKQYLNFTGFSYTGLIKQLEFEHYSHEEAVYAADNCGADWNEQAVRSAKQYLAFTAFSRDGLIKQLEFEGYTHSQATHAADQCGY